VAVAVEVPARVAVAVEVPARAAVAVEVPARAAVAVEVPARVAVAVPQPAGATSTRRQSSPRCKELVLLRCSAMPRRSVLFAPMWSRC